MTSQRVHKENHAQKADYYKLKCGIFLALNKVFVARGLLGGIQQVLSETLILSSATALMDPRWKI